VRQQRDDHQRAETEQRQARGRGQPLEPTRFRHEQQVQATMVGQRQAGQNVGPRNDPNRLAARGSGPQRHGFGRGLA
jgi:hypothetical protein